LLLAELLQITPIHADMDSEFLKLGKRRRNARLQSAKWPWVITYNRSVRR
jgi:hypothetical protein